MVDFCFCSETGRDERDDSDGVGQLERRRQRWNQVGGPLEKDSVTDPAQLIAAAHASSFSQALLSELRLRTFAKGNIVTAATVTLAHLATGWTIMNINLNVVAKLPKVTQGKFIDATVRAKTNCLVSRLVRANISMNAKLEN